jgi:His-Xaa-Ser system protein HxsD
MDRTNLYIQAENSEMANHEAMTFYLDSEVYSLQAIKRASYDFTDRCFITIGSAGSKQIALTVTMRGTATNDTVQELMNSILDHQIRSDLEQEFGDLRTIIVAQAFSPCSNLEEIIRISKNA